MDNNQYKNTLIGERFKTVVLIIMGVMVIGTVIGSIVNKDTAVYTIISTVLPFISTVLTFVVYNAFGSLINIQQINLKKYEDVSEKLKRQTEGQRHIYEELVNIKEILMSQSPEDKEPIKYKPIPGTIRCSKCKALNPEEATECEICGEKITNE